MRCLATDFRYNTVLSCTEYRPVALPADSFTPLDSRMLRRIIRAKEETHLLVLLDFALNGRVEVLESAVLLAHRIVRAADVDADGVRGKDTTFGFAHHTFLYVSCDSRTFLSRFCGSGMFVFLMIT